MLRLSAISKYGLTGLGCIMLILLVASCKKYMDEPGKNDPRLSRKYCNDPEAVNFNRDFPGTEDNSVCYYPSDAFKGSYRFTDSIYIGSDTILRPLTISITAQSKTKFSLTGLCDGSPTPVTFTATRVLRASVDTTIVEGQALCRPKDTVSGYIIQPLSDSTQIHFYLTVVSDTGTARHEGTAYRQ